VDSKRAAPYELQREGGLLISDDPSRIDLDVVYGYLSRAYWCAGIPRPLVERAVQSSLVFGVFAHGKQVGFARVVTDSATFAYLCDVFILEPFQGAGLGKWLVEAVLDHPRLQGLRRFVLATRDAHRLYERYGFRPLANPDRFMERHDPDAYRK
jgi:ribosomal protein S18 acetylase RimI-like enzyme